ncbi:hypothetical protein L1987_11597 [Smallanthus sonchifolius]|uniref:Uncharacterized protein n=1 Tax=Smallanthus sonchifolius TaxID=185202 RepID=A0ACB9JBX3_9ASTR|nr:hypothetical protein L1987_11597 [Smallanthus sonchifolius]
MTTTTTNGTSTSPTKTPKKTNLLDHHSIKHLLDETVTEIVTSRGYSEDVRMGNVRLLIGAIIIIIALFAQSYNKKFPDNKNFLIGCILIIYTKEKNAFLFTYHPAVSCASLNIGLPRVVSGGNGIRTHDLAVG